MKDVLCEIGTIVEVENTHDEIMKYIIIGKRCINHETMKSWDYVSVPFNDGFMRIFNKRDKEVIHYENFFYFNHYEIEKILFIPDNTLFSTPKEGLSIREEDI